MDSELRPGTLGHPNFSVDHEFIGAITVLSMSSEVSTAKVRQHFQY